MFDEKRIVMFADLANKLTCQYLERSQSRQKFLEKMQRSLKGIPEQDPSAVEMFYVELRPRMEDEKDPKFERYGPFPLQSALYVERGLKLNLDHEHYYVQVIPTNGDGSRE